ATIHGSLLDAFVVDTAAVVFDFDVDVIAAMVSAESDATGFWLAAERAAIGKFDAMGDGIAVEADERVGNLLNDVVVELGFTAGEVEFDKLAGGVGGVANGTRETRV